jgi:hypothetical protein
VRYWQGRRVWGTASAKPFTCQQSAGRKLLLLLLEGASASAAASAMATLPVAVTTAIGVRSVEFIDDGSWHDLRWVAGTVGAN